MLAHMLLRANAWHTQTCLSDHLVASLLQITEAEKMLSSIIGSAMWTAGRDIHYLFVVIQLLI